MADIDEQHSLISLASMAEVAGAKSIDEGTGVATCTRKNPVSGNMEDVQVPLGFGGWRIVRRGRY